MIKNLMAKVSSLIEQANEIKKALEQESTQTEERQLGNEFLTTAEAANYLGVKKTSLYVMISKGDIGCYKPNGKKCYFAVNELNEYLTRKRRKSINEIENNLSKVAINRNN